METPTRASIIKEIALDNYNYTFKDVKPKIVGPFKGPYDIRGFAVDPLQPVIALYDSHQFESADFLAMAAARMRRRGQTAVNFVIVADGLHAERIIDTEGIKTLAIDAGYTYDHNGKIYVFDQPEKPLLASMADTSVCGKWVNPTMQQLSEANIPLLRSKDYFKYDDKSLTKQRLQEFDIVTPQCETVSLDDLAIRPEDTLPQRFVIKPRTGFGGDNVHIFSQGFDRHQLDLVIDSLRDGGYKDALVEEYVESIALKLNEIDRPASFNLRVIIFNGYCGAFARVHPEGVPGNVHQGAFTLSLPKIKQSLLRQQGLNPVTLQHSIEHCADQISNAFPDCMIGADVMIDKEGNPQIIELNFGDFGAFDRKAFSQKDWITALEKTVSNITTVAQTHPTPIASNADSVEWSVVDFSEYSITKLKNMDYSQYYSDDDVFNEDKFKRHHGKLMRQAFEHLEVRRLAGDNQQSVPGYHLIKILAELSKAKRLTKRVDSALAHFDSAAHFYNTED